MSKAEKLRLLQTKGYEIADRDIRKAERDERRDSRPEPPKPDLLQGVVKNFIDEIKRESLQHKIEATQLISQIADALREGLKELKPEPKPKKLEVTDSNGKLKYTIKVKQV